MTTPGPGRRTVDDRQLQELARELPVRVLDEQEIGQLTERVQGALVVQRSSSGRAGLWGWLVAAAVILAASVGLLTTFMVRSPAPQEAVGAGAAERPSVDSVRLAPALVVAEEAVPAGPEPDQHVDPGAGERRAGHGRVDERTDGSEARVTQMGDTPPPPATLATPLASFDAPGPQGPIPGEFLSRGLELLEQGDFGSAAEQFRKEASLGVLREDALFWEAVAYTRAGHLDEAIGALQTFVDDYPASSRAAEAHCMFGWLLADSDEPTSARPHFEAAAASTVERTASCGQSGLDSL